MADPCPIMDKFLSLNVSLHVSLSKEGKMYASCHYPGHGSAWYPISMTLTYDAQQTYDDFEREYHNLHSENVTVRSGKLTRMPLPS